MLLAENKTKNSKEIVFHFQAETDFWIQSAKKFYEQSIRPTEKRKYDTLVHLGSRIILSPSDNSIISLKIIFD